MPSRPMLLALPVLAASAAGAHPGHGAPGDGSSLAHYLGEPLHVGFALAVALGLAALGLRVRRRAPVRGRSRS